MSKLLLIAILVLGSILGNANACDDVIVGNTFVGSTCDAGFSTISNNDRLTFFRGEWWFFNTDNTWSVFRGGRWLRASGRINVFNNFHNDVVTVLEKRVQFDDRYYLGLDGYYSIGQNYSQKAAQDSANNLADALKTINTNIVAVGTKVDNLANAINNIPTPNPIPTPTPIPNPTPDPQPEPKPPPNPTPTPTPKPPSPAPTPTPNPQPNPANATELDKKAFQIFSQNCATCHSAQTHNGGLVLVDGNTLNKPPLNEMILIQNRVEGTNLNGKTRMPKGKPALTDIDVKTIESWVVEEAEALNKQ